MSWIPNGFTPSELAHRRTYDEESRFRGDAGEPGGEDGELAGMNSFYGTSTEGQVAPFIARNKAKDEKRRNYVIEPGGACVYDGSPASPGRVYAPTAQESFGHFSQPRDRGRGAG